ncbi:MAG: SurA N-terminal domain-containing protein [Xanthobacteraceae bacterium]|nr:SurA N-terminal domain-containing protein [Xanthobacteraceae bacterium]
MAMQSNWAVRRAFMVAATIAMAQMPTLPGLAQAAEIDAIPRSAVDQRIRLKQLDSPGSAPSRDEVFDELLKEWETIDRTRKLGIRVSVAEVEEAYAQIAARMQLTAEQLTQRLARSGIRAYNLKNRIRADIARHRYQQQPRLWQDPDLLPP